MRTIAWMGFALALFGTSSAHAQTDEGMSREAALRVFLAHHHDLQVCFQRAYGERATARGSVSVTIRPNGRVASASLSLPDLAERVSLPRCIMATTRRWRFPTASEPTNLTFPIEFVAEPGEPAPSASTGPARPTSASSASASRSRAEIQRVVRSALGSFRACYDPFVAEEPLLDGHLRLQIAPDGTVEDANFTTTGRTSTATSEVAACIGVIASQLRFPVASSGASIGYPLRFGAEGSSGMSGHSASVDPLR